MFSTLVRVTLSVISLCMLCKSAMAEEVDAFWNAFHVGGYSSIDMRLPRTESAQLKWNEVSMIVTWDQGGGVKFFSELELKAPLAYDHPRGSIPSKVMSILSGFTLTITSMKRPMSVQAAF